MMRHPYFWMYNAFSVLALPPLAGAALGYLLKRPDHFRGASQRMGRIPHSILNALEGTPRIWMQAVSMGEVHGAASLSKALLEVFPRASILVSVTTPDGYRHARDRIPPPVQVVYYTLDLWPCVLRSLDRVRPDLYIALETELWPNFLDTAHHQGVMTVLANGRISSRSFRRYRLLRPFFKWVLDRFDLCCVTGDTDAERLLALGVDPKRIRITGNSKYDLADREMDPERVQELSSRLDLEEDRLVWVLGSIRGSEVPMVTQAVQEVLSAGPKVCVIAAPRHLGRIPVLEESFRMHGVETQRWSRLASEKERRTRQVILLDTMGELFAFYGMADVVFCGASLVPLGGQNVMEPAAWGRCPLYGPYMDDFREAVRHLESLKGGVRVRNAQELAQTVLWLLEHPEDRNVCDENARAAFQSFTGASRRTAETIRELWNRGRRNRVRTRSMPR